MIFLYLPALELLLDQRVCKRWLFVIEETSSIQKKLCFKAADTPGNPRRHKLIYSPAHVMWEGRDWVEFEYYNRWIRRRTTSPTYAVTKKHECAFSWCTDDIIARKEASWRKMFVTQPPITRLICSYHRDGRRNSRRSTRIEDPNGIRMGQLFPEYGIPVKLKGGKVYLKHFPMTEKYVEPRP